MIPILGQYMKALEDPNLSAEQKQLLNEIQGVRYVVINKQHGGFGLSQAGIQRYLEIKELEFYCKHNDHTKRGFLNPTYWLVPEDQQLQEPSAETWHSMTLAERQQHNKLWESYTFSDRDLDRDDPVLVQVVKEMGPDAGGRFAALKIVEIPADVEWQIEEYDGLEWVAEKHRTWS